MSGFAPLPNFQPPFLSGYIPAPRRSIGEEVLGSALGAVATKGVGSLMDKYLVSEEDKLRMELIQNQIENEKVNRGIAQSNAGIAVADSQTRAKVARTQVERYNQEMQQAADRFEYETGQRPTKEQMDQLQLQVLGAQVQGLEQANEYQPRLWEADLGQKEATTRGQTLQNDAFVEDRKSAQLSQFIDNYVRGGVPSSKFNGVTTMDEARQAVEQHNAEIAQDLSDSDSSSGGWWSGLLKDKDKDSEPSTETVQTNPEPSPAPNAKTQRRTPRESAPTAAWVDKVGTAMESKEYGNSGRGRTRRELPVATEQEVQIAPMTPDEYVEMYLNQRGHVMPGGRGSVLTMEQYRGY